MDDLFFRGRHRPLWRRRHGQQRILQLLAMADASERSDGRAKRSNKPIYAPLRVRRGKSVVAVHRLSLFYGSLTMRLVFRWCTSSKLSAVLVVARCTWAAAHQDNNMPPPLTTTTKLGETKDHPFHHGTTSGHDCLKSQHILFSNSYLL
jgi:hypothetical protein